MTRTRTLATLAALVAACASPNATIDVTVGCDPTAAPTPGCVADALTRDPAVASFELDALDEGAANPAPIKQGIGAQGDVDLGDVSQGEVASLQLSGRDATDAGVVFGATPFVALGALSGATIPLFVQRRRELAGMPGSIMDGREAPLLSVTPRGIYYGGGSVAGATSPPGFSGYDLLFLDGLNAACAAVVDAKSLALVTLATTDGDGDSAVASLIANDSIQEMGLPSCSSSTLAATPTGMTAWSEVAGGRTVMGDDGTAYVVGPSKVDAPSKTILALPPEGADGGSPAATVGFSSSARRAAAVAWAPGRGIFIYGGSADPTKTLSAAEIVNADLKVSFVGDYPLALRQHPDAPELAAIAFDANQMLVAGDGETPRLVDLTCARSCTPAAWGVAPPFALAAPALFALGNQVFLLVGDDPGGATHVFRMDPSSTNPVELAIPRTRARAVQTATGEVVILGGGSDVLESYFD